MFLDYTESCNVLSESSNVNENGSKALVLNPVNSEGNDDPEEPPGGPSWWDKSKPNKGVPMLKLFRIWKYS